MRPRKEIEKEDLKHSTGVNIFTEKIYNSEVILLKDFKKQDKKRNPRRRRIKR